MGRRKKLRISRVSTSKDYNCTWQDKTYHTKCLQSKLVCNVFGFSETQFFNFQIWQKLQKCYNLAPKVPKNDHFYRYLMVYTEKLSDSSLITFLTNPLRPDDFLGSIESQLSVGSIGMMLYAKMRF